MRAHDEPRARLGRLPPRPRPAPEQHARRGRPARRRRSRPGERMGSMMAPSLAFDDDGLVLAAGAAGGTRLRSALVGVLAGILDEGLAPQEAVDRPRFHPAGRRRQRRARGRTRRRWPRSSAAGCTVRALAGAAPLLRRRQAVTRAGARATRGGAAPCGTPLTGTQSAEPVASWPRSGYTRCSSRRLSPSLRSVMRRLSRSETPSCSRGRRSATQRCAVAVVRLDSEEPDSGANEPARSVTPLMLNRARPALRPSARRRRRGRSASTSSASLSKARSSRRRCHSSTTSRSP